MPFDSVFVKESQAESSSLAKHACAKSSSLHFVAYFIRTIQDPGQADSPIRRSLTEGLSVAK
jgi:hypothetical protein